MFNYINFNANKRPVKVHFCFYSSSAKIQILLQGFYRYYLLSREKC